MWTSKVGIMHRDSSMVDVMGYDVNGNLIPPPLKRVKTTGIDNGAAGMSMSSQFYANGYAVVGNPSASSFIYRPPPSFICPPLSFNYPPPSSAGFNYPPPPIYPPSLSAGIIYPPPPQPNWHMASPTVRSYKDKSERISYGFPPNKEWNEDCRGGNYKLPSKPGVDDGVKPPQARLKLEYPDFSDLETRIGYKGPTRKVEPPTYMEILKKWKRLRGESLPSDDNDDDKGSIRKVESDDDDKGLIKKDEGLGLGLPSDDDDKALIRKDEGLPSDAKAGSLPRDKGWVMTVESLDIDSLFKGVPYLVTRNQEKVPCAELKGKYVILACFFTPVEGSALDRCRSLIYSSNKLATLGVDSIRIVIVSKMRRDWDSSEKAFNNFFSSFPDGFLAVPWSDPCSRDYIAWSLNLSFDGETGVVVDPTGNILQKGLHFLSDYGAASFPFTRSHLEELDMQDLKWRAMLDPFSCRTSSLRLPGNRHSYFNAESYFTELVHSRPRLTLADLLDNCLLLQYLGANNSRYVPLSALDGKLVGLYLPYDGSLKGKLMRLHEQFRNQDPSFEVVLVPLAIQDDPSSLQYSFCVPNWFTIPYDDTICRTLWRIAGRPRQDSLVLLPYRGGHSGEVKAHVVISLLGNRVYPFTRERIFDVRMSATIKVTLPSLLKRFGPVYQWGTGLRVPPQHLEGKNTLLCLCNDTRSRFFSLLVQQYPKIQAAFPDAKVIFVPSHIESCPEVVKALQWLMLHSDPDPLTYPTVLDLVSQSLFSEDLGESVRKDCILVAFGDNGHISSREAQFYIEDEDIRSLFNNHLTEEIVAEITSQLNNAETTSMIAPMTNYAPPSW